MNKFKSVLAFFLLFITQLSFADDTVKNTNLDDENFKPCEVIAKACLHAGYSHKNGGKMFWRDCMKPVVMGKSVDKVSVAATDVKACRDFKISSMEKQLEQLKSVSQ